MDLPELYDPSYDPKDYEKKFFTKIRNIDQESKPIHDKSCVGFVRILPDQIMHQEITTFPFVTDFKGEVDLSSYFKTEENSDGVVSGTFRGRLLHGQRVLPPENCATYTIQSTDRPNGQKLMNVTGTVKHTLSFEFDRLPGPHCRLQSEMSQMNNTRWMKPSLSQETRSLTRLERLAVIKAASKPQLCTQFLGKDFDDVETDERVIRLKALAAHARNLELDVAIEEEFKEDVPPKKSFAELFPQVAEQYGLK